MMIFSFHTFLTPSNVQKACNWDLLPIKVASSTNADDDDDDRHHHHHVYFFM